MTITSVKISGTGYTLNGTMYVEKDENNPYYKAIKDYEAAGGIIEPEFTDAELASNALDEWLANRSAAYRNESDPLKVEAEYDAMQAGMAPDYTAWLAKVGEIKARYPKPQS